MRWWAESSKGDVHIVLLVADKANKKIQILKYVPGTSPTVQGFMTDITITTLLVPLGFRGPHTGVCQGVQSFTYFGCGTGYCRE